MEIKPWNVSFWNITVLVSEVSQVEYVDSKER